MRRAFSHPGFAPRRGPVRVRAMNGNDIIELARRTYLEELAQFVVKQASRFPNGLPEAATNRTENPALFGGHYRVDFIGQQGDKGLAIDLVPDRRVRMEAPMEGVAGGMRVRMEQIVWDDVEISHDAPGDLTPALGTWFGHWYDPDEQRKPAAEGHSVDVIHSLGVYPGKLVVDFGSAAPSAFWALVNLLRDAGAGAITIRETRAAA